MTKLIWLRVRLNQTATARTCRVGRSHSFIIISNPFHITHYIWLIDKYWRVTQEHGSVLLSSQQSKQILFWSADTYVHMHTVECVNGDHCGTTSGLRSIETHTCISHEGSVARGHGGLSHVWSGPAAQFSWHLTRSTSCGQALALCCEGQGSTNEGSPNSGMREKMSLTQPAVDSHSSYLFLS